mgnify:CR=1 FL=1
MKKKNQEQNMMEAEHEGVVHMRGCQLEKDAININSRCNDTLTRKIDFEVFE